MGTSPTTTRLIPPTQSCRPYLTQLILTPMIYCIGDLSAQTLSADEYFPHRTLRNLIIGLIIALPSREWFLFLGQRFNYASSPSLSLAAKVVANQLIYTPLFNVYFFAFHGLLSGEGCEGAVERVRDTVPTSVPRSFLYWPLVTAFNFSYVRPQSRAIVTSGFAVFGQSYLSWLNSSAEKGESKQAKRAKDSNLTSSSPIEEDSDRLLLMFDDK